MFRFGGIAITPLAPGVTVNVTVAPPRRGWVVELWWLISGKRIKIATEETDANSRAALTFSSSYYPVTMQAVIPPGQTLDGVEYGGAQSEELVCRDGDIKDVSLELTPVTPPPPPPQPSPPEWGAVALAGALPTLFVAAVVAASEAGRLLG